MGATRKTGACSFWEPVPQFLLLHDAPQVRWIEANPCFHNFALRREVPQFARRHLGVWPASCRISCWFLAFGLGWFSFGFRNGHSHHGFQPILRPPLLPRSLFSLLASEGSQRTRGAATAGRSRANVLFQPVFRRVASVRVGGEVLLRFPCGFLGVAYFRAPIFGLFERNHRFFRGPQFVFLGSPLHLSLETDPSGRTEARSLWTLRRHCSRASMGKGARRHVLVWLSWSSNEGASSTVSLFQGKPKEAPLVLEC